MQSIPEGLLDEILELDPSLEGLVGGIIGTFCNPLNAVVPGACAVDTSAACCLVSLVSGRCYAEPMTWLTMHNYTARWRDRLGLL